MEIFVYNQDSPREPLQAFNERLQTFCLDNPIIAVNAAAVGPSIIVSMTHADDLGAENMPTLLAQVVSLNGTRQTLEEEFTALLDAWAAHNREDDPRIPARMDIIARNDNPLLGFGVLQMVTGEVDSDPDDGVMYEPTR